MENMIENENNYPDNYIRRLEYQIQVLTDELLKPTRMNVNPQIIIQNKIGWMEWKSGTPTETKDYYLVTNGTTVGVCYCEKDRRYGYTWWDRNYTLFAGVTHYAEINLP